MQVPELPVVQAAAAYHQAELVEGEALAYAHGERKRHDLDVQLAVVAGGHLVEAVTVVGYDPGEDVEPACRAFRVGLAADQVRQRQGFRQGHQVGPSGLQDSSFPAQVELVDDQVPDFVPHLFVARQEAAADAIGALSQAQVQAGGLYVAGRDPQFAGIDPSCLDGLGYQLAGEHARDGLAEIGEAVEHDH